MNKLVLKGFGYFVLFVGGVVNVGVEVIVNVVFERVYV